MFYLIYPVFFIAYCLHLFLVSSLAYDFSNPCFYFIIVVIGKLKISSFNGLLLLSVPLKNLHSKETWESYPSLMSENFAI